MLRALMDVGFRAIWATLSSSNRIFLLFFCGVSCYTFWVSVRATIGLRDALKQRASGDASVGSLRLKSLRRRLANLRQLHLFTVLLLWFCIAINLPDAFDVMGLYKTWPADAILEKLRFFFYYYAPVIFVFVLLHSLQWLISSRVEASLEKSG